MMPKTLTVVIRVDRNVCEVAKYEIKLSSLSSGVLQVPYSIPHNHLNDTGHIVHSSENGPMKSCLSNLAPLPLVAVKSSSSNTRHMFAHHPHHGLIQFNHCHLNFHHSHISDTRKVSKRQLSDSVSNISSRASCDTTLTFAG